MRSKEARETAPWFVATEDGRVAYDWDSAQREAGGLAAKGAIFALRHVWKADQPGLELGRHFEEARRRSDPDHSGCQRWNPLPDRRGLSCAEFMAEGIKRRGVREGIGLGVKRIQRCGHRSSVLPEPVMSEREELSDHHGQGVVPLEVKGPAAELSAQTGWRQKLGLAAALVLMPVCSARSGLSSKEKDELIRQIPKQRPGREDCWDAVGARLERGEPVELLLQYGYYDGMRLEHVSVIADRGYRKVSDGCSSKEELAGYWLYEAGRRGIFGRRRNFKLEYVSLLELERMADAGVVVRRRMVYDEQDFQLFLGEVFGVTYSRFKTDRFDVDAEARRGCF